MVVMMVIRTQPKPGDMVMVIRIQPKPGRRGDGDKVVIQSGRQPKPGPPTHTPDNVGAPRPNPKQTLPYPHLYTCISNMARYMPSQLTSHTLCFNCTANI